MSVKRRVEKLEQGDGRSRLLVRVYDENSPPGAFEAAKAKADGHRIITMDLTGGRPPSKPIGAKQ